MSLDRSLRSKSTLARHRNVLTRAERIGVLKETGRWEDGRLVTGLPKVAHRKASVGKKAKEKAVEGAPAEGAAGATAAAPAAAAADKKAAPAADKKAAAKPAKGGKG